MAYKANNKVTRDLILSNITQEDIFKKYLGFEPSFNKKFINPLRSDNHADCSFYTRGNKLYFKDFAYGYHWDCFNVVEFMYNVNFKKALEIIASDFNIISTVIDRPDIKKIEQRYEEGQIEKPVYKAKIRKFNKRDLDWWGLFGIDLERLNKFYVYAVERAWEERNGITKLIYHHTVSNPCYAYYLGNGELKLYFPLAQEPKPKFLHSNRDTLQGYYLLPEIGNDLVITKSYKDVIALDIFDISAVAPQAESIMINQEQFTDLYNRFDNIYTLFDRDRAGILMTIKMRKTYPITPLMFTKDDEKDLTDNIKDRGLNYITDYIDYLREIL